MNPNDHDHHHHAEAEAQKCDYNKKTIHRIHRIQGQLAALERLIEADEGTCEERVIRARAIEKGMTSLISHLVECYLVNTAQHQMEEAPEDTTKELVRIFDLLNH
jgi:DNA-binding FrmR family transcriptional regulator